MIRNVWNPFVRNSERKLLCIGLISFFIAVVLTNYNDVLMLGSLKIVNTKPKLWYVSLYNLTITVVANTLLMYLFAILRFAKTRFIDVFNSVLIAHIAMYLLLLITVIPFVADFLKSIEFLVLDNIGNPVQMPLDKMVIMMIFGLFAIGCLVIFFLLLVMGMKIAMNSKKTGDTIVIILSTLLLNTLLQLLHIYL